MEKQTFKIRYNTNATSDKNCWRVIDSNGIEILVDDIVIQTGCCTTKDWMEETKEFKYHITCVGSLMIKNHCAVIS